MPFTAVWVLLLFVWIAILAFWLLTQKSSENKMLAVSFIKSAGKYAAILLVLYVLGLHLAGVLALPFYIAFIMKRLKPLSKPLYLTAGAMLLLMAVSVPLAYASFPKVASEPETRVAAVQTTKDLSKLAASSDPSNAAMTHDPFAYTRFNVPLLAPIVQALDKSFYTPDNLPIKVKHTASQKLLWSRGPDGDFDFSAKSLPDPLDLTTTSPSPVAAFTYDATNGVLSGGDIIVLGTAP